MDKIDNIFGSYIFELYRFINSYIHDSHQSEDILQETLYKAYVALDTYTGEDIKPWLFVIAKNTCMDFFRKQKKIVILSDEYFQTIQSDTNTEATYEIKETIHEVLLILDQLPPIQKEAFILKVFKNFTYEEGAEMMRMKTAKFKSLVFRTRKTIKKRLRGE